MDFARTVLGKRPLFRRFVNWTTPRLFRTSRRSSHRGIIFFSRSRRIYLHEIDKERRAYRGGRAEKGKHRARKKFGKCPQGNVGGDDGSGDALARRYVRAGGPLARGKYGEKGKDAL